MSYIDLIILALLVINGFQGVRRGLIRIIMDLVAIGGSILLALKWNVALSLTVGPTLAVSDKTAQVLSFFIIWGISFIIVMSLGKALDMVFSGSILGPLNRIGGLVLGVARGGVFVSLLLIPLLMMNVEFVEDSIVIRKVGPVLQQMIDGYLPDALPSKAPIENS